VYFIAALRTRKRGQAPDQLSVNQCQSFFTSPYDETLNSIMKIKRLCIGLLALLLAFPSWRLLAQSTFKSKYGSLSITASYFDLPLTVHTKAVSEIILILSPTALHTGIDSIDHRLKIIDNTWVLRGNLNLGRINTTTHAPQNFQLTGILELLPNQKLTVKGIGRLEHIGGGEEMACELAFYFDLDLEPLGISALTGPSGSENLVKVRFFETVLRKVN